jgi:catechol 2,3-dioxygenase-like lactoylglutathione lyase family enzyme
MGNDFKDFEIGKMDRRQLLRTLGLTATSVAIASAMPNFPGLAASVAQKSADGGKEFPVTTINHLSLAVADYAKSRDFYVDLFGMRVRWDDGKRCEVQFGSMTSPNGIYIGGLSKPGDKPNVGHIAFGIPNFWAQRAAIKAEMERRGQKNIRPDGEGGWMCDIPAGYMVQVVPEMDPAMFPGAASPCEVAASEKCKTAFEVGLKNLSTVPKPSGNGFTATSLSHIVLNVPDMPKEIEFFRDLLGMKVITSKLDGPNPECLLGFGKNTLDLHATNKPDEKPSCNQYGFVIENFDQKKVEAELKRRGLNPEQDPKWAWAIKDPDGLRIGVTGKA